MTNAEIFVNSLNDWITPIVQSAVDHKINNNFFAGMAAEIIDPSYFIETTKQHLGFPVVLEYVAMVPDDKLPSYSLAILDGMIDTRRKKGAFSVPFLGVRLGPTAFEDLRHQTEQNYLEYSESYRKVAGVTVEPIETETTEQN